LFAYILKRTGIPKYSWKAAYEPKGEGGGEAGNGFYLGKVTWEQNILTLNTYGGTLKEKPYIEAEVVYGN